MCSYIDNYDLLSLGTNVPNFANLQQIIKIHILDLFFYRYNKNFSSNHFNKHTVVLSLIDQSKINKLPIIKTQYDF